MTFRDQFPSYPVADMPRLPAGFVDQSYRNDVCPHFDNDAARIAVWIDHPDRALREYPECKRFTVHSIDADGYVQEMLFESDVWQDVLKFLQDREFDALVAEYTAWNKAQGLDLGSADEHLFDESLTDAQRAWVQDFSERWEAMERMNDN